MVTVLRKGAYLLRGKTILEAEKSLGIDEINGMLSKIGEPAVPVAGTDIESARENTMAYRILSAHNVSGDKKNLKVKFDALASHDITYVGIVQTARASGLKEFPIPYVLTNCHNSLCAVGGTINEDDHVFGLSAAQKYGGIYVPAHQAVIHQYMREMMSGCGKMILGSDSHTRYGSLGTMGIGEGGPELVKQLLSKTYDTPFPGIVAVYLENKPVRGVGPQDVALAIIGAVFKDGFVKNKVLEFVGPGITNLSVDYRNGIDVMTTETTCLTSIWRTDDMVKEYYETHGRPKEYKELNPGDVAYYDGVIKVDLSKVEPMIALPFHPSNVFSISELNRSSKEILSAVEEDAKKQLDNPNIKLNITDKLVNGRIKVNQGIVAGCSGGTFENICYVANAFKAGSIGDDEFTFSVYPQSQPVFMELNKVGAINTLMAAGITVRSAFCGPCFGAGDVPANNAFSIRHCTRNFPNREGSKPGNGQIASVALMDARSIAATALNKGLLTPATELDIPESYETYTFNKKVYDNRVYKGYGKPDKAMELKFGPNIADWPQMVALTDNIVLKIVSVIDDPVTTTDELIPSGETSSYRSNPLKLAEFTLSRKDPAYVGKAKEVQLLETERRELIKQSSADKVSESMKQLLAMISANFDKEPDAEILKSTGIGSVIYANKPGDGSAREQAASCQKVLGGWANVCLEYATKRYRSNLINWGIIPFTVDEEYKSAFAADGYLYVPGIRKAMESGSESADAFVVSKDGVKNIKVKLAALSKDDRDIILSGCLINYYAK